MHLMNCTRPDITYDVGRLSRYTHCPDKNHSTALYRVLKYLKETINYNLLYCDFSSILKRYSDANWISDSDELKSTSGYVIVLGGGCGVLKSSKQTVTTCFTMESEFVALEKISTEAEWLRIFLIDIPI